MSRPPKGNKKASAHPIDAYWLFLCIDIYEKII
jgi:hypothetical protein